ncbi:hypothetical protein PInf_021073 [Phytophthora infestans]|nr:hypothetical protein PInf_027083 [Phytophthora infestans]KAI9990263.1 hypothetical protein PInf_021073 [Phytophthora infestans]
MEKLDKLPEMFWLGKQPGRFSREARKYDGSIADDLAVLREKGRNMYDATLESALDPAKVDAYGYPSMRVFLESTDALNLVADEKNRLTIATLARIRKNIMFSVRPKDIWVGDRTADPRKSIVNSYTVMQAQDLITVQIIKGYYELPYWSDFEENAKSVGNTGSYPYKLKNGVSPIPSW